jgi:hypothetical protein
VSTHPDTKASQFMERVVPWPAEGEPGFINLHWRIPNPHDATKPDIWTGKPTRTVGEFMKLLAWVQTRANTRDIYYCLSRQALSAKNTKGNTIAARLAENATFLKAIWLDMDVKAPPKGYATPAEAVEAVMAFCKAANLPGPSAIVASGGGLHVYWISETPLGRDDWQGYANGLKAAAINFGLRCDIGCTIDSARVLRVPGTKNYKQLPLRPVVVKGFGPHYNFPATFAHLKALAPAMAAPSSSAAPFDLTNFPTRVPTGPIESLAEGLRHEVLLDIGPLLAKGGCGFLREAFAAGGKDYDQPQWNITTLLSTFLENGEKLAHKMGDKHPGYDPSSTDDLWARKVAERKSRNLGWPSCNAIQAAGSKACAACPHLGKFKSPLHLTAPIANADPGQSDCPREKFQPSGGYGSIEPDDPLLAKLNAQWPAMLCADNYAAGYPSRAVAECAFVVAAVRAGIADSVVARCVMDRRRKFGSHTRGQPNLDRELARLIEHAHQYVLDPDLADMNDKFFVTPIGDATRVVTMKADPHFTGRRVIGRAQSFYAFTDLHSNKRKKWETIDKDGVPKFTEIPLGKWWLNQKLRRQYDGGMSFMPQHDTDVVGDTLNLWRGFAVQSRKPEGTSGAAGCQLMLDHIKYVLCSGNEEHYDYFIKREAKIFQERCRTEIGMILRSKAEGSGKGFFEKHVHGKLLGSAYMQVTSPDHVIGKHNQHLEGLLVLCADEALFAGDPRHRNALYSLITEPTIAVEPKFVGVYSAPNFVNADLLSNMDHVVFVGPTARRLFIPAVSEDRVGDLEHFAKIEAQLCGHGYEALLYHFLHEVSLRDFDVRKVPKTEGLREQARYSRRGIDLLVEQVCNEAQIPCPVDGHPDRSFTNMDPTVPGSLDFMLSHSRDRELQKPLTVKRRLCSDWGCMAGDAARVWNGNRHVSCIQWPALADLRDLFVKQHGPQTWDRADVPEWHASGNSVDIGAEAAQAAGGADTTGGATFEQGLAQGAAQSQHDPPEPGHPRARSTGPLL